MRSGCVREGKVKGQYAKNKFEGQEGKGEPEIEGKRMESRREIGVECEAAKLKLKLKMKGL